ncbi:MAG: tetratricopeptide repeat protein [Anaerolineae bacterium]|nr:tetratricopeptide repeat protein [Anaerolineae bacterium]NUQ03235.1 tetratricopeptide repeat protein [Anaerolineae bacterium]
MALADKIPDLENMTEAEMEAWAASLSPDELMEFMDFLARRQGATEGFTTEASNIDLPSIDASKVNIDEPGYVPFGSSSEQASAPPPPPKPAAPPVREAPAVKPTPTVPQTPAQPAARAPQPAAPSTPPWEEPQPPRRPVVPPSRPPVPSFAESPAAAKPVEPPPPPPPAAEAVDSGALAWLESLAAEQGDDLFNLDLSGIGSPEPAAAPSLDNPMTWLEDLARSQGRQEFPGIELERIEDDMDEGSEKIDPFASKADPVTWLETLARRGGADPDELISSTRLNIPIPSPDEVEVESYKAFSFDSPLAHPRAVDDDSTPVNPSDFLNSLAGDEGYSESGVVTTQPAASEPEEYSMESIQDALSKGTVTPDQMQYFLEQQAEHLVENPDLLFGDEDEEEVIIEPLVADIPDWLKEMQPVEEQPPAGPTKPLEALFEVSAQPADLEIPPWLIEAESTGVSVEIADIFAPEAEEPVPPSVVSIEEPTPYVIEVDPSDPWVEAFDSEQLGDVPDVDQVPDWYERNISDPSRIAALDTRYGLISEDEPLIEAHLPAETGLPVGQPQPLPAWMIGIESLIEAVPELAAPSAPSSDLPFIGDMPEWLKEIEVQDEVPGWLKDSIAAVEPVDVAVEFAPSEPEPEPEPVPVARKAAAQPPAPKPEPARAAPPVSDEETAALVQNARDLEQAGDLETSLAEYESLIRRNRALDVVVDDLAQLVRSYRTVPAVYRVLGDGLMRQGKLQAALDTYREALNQL